MSEHSDEFLAEITEKFLADLPAGIDRHRVREELNVVRVKNRHIRTLELSYAVLSVMYHDALTAIEELHKLVEIDETIINAGRAESDVSQVIIDYHENRSAERQEAVGKGGNVKATRMNALREETIRLYKLGSWKNAAEAALEITPKIVNYSKGQGNLSPTTQKPLAWIREYIRQKK